MLSKYSLHLNIDYIKRKHFNYFKALGSVVLLPSFLWFWGGELPTVLKQLTRVTKQMHSALAHYMLSRLWLELENKNEYVISAAVKLLGGCCSFFFFFFKFLVRRTYKFKMRRKMYNKVNVLVWSLKHLAPYAHVCEGFCFSEQLEQHIISLILFDPGRNTCRSLFKWGENWL